MKPLDLTADKRTRRKTDIKRFRRFCRFAGLSVCQLVLLAACRSSQQDKEILARVGAREFTRSDLVAAAGLPLDSLPSATRWRILDTWIERTLVDLEGQRRGLDKDPQLREKLGALKSDLYRARLLADSPVPSPADSTVERYYLEHQKEFLRPTDAYLIELFWAEDINRLMEFRQQLPGNDTTLLVQGIVRTEGRWLAEAGELDPDLERELDSLNTSAVTLPRPYGDGYRVAHLLEKFPAGTVLRLDAVRDEIKHRLLIEDSRRRQDQLVIDLRRRYPVEVMVKDSL